jgi:hypothetical protein
MSGWMHDLRIHGVGLGCTMSGTFPVKCNEQENTTYKLLHWYYS